MWTALLVYFYYTLAYRCLPAVKSVLQVWVSITHLVEPLPLERNNDLDETGNDAGEINIAYNLWHRKRR